MIKEIIFTFNSNGRSLSIDEPEYDILDYEGLEATDYELEEQININGIGATKKKTKLLPRPISLEFDYIGGEEDKSRIRQELISFFSPFRGGELTVSYLGVKRKIQYEVTGFFVNSKLLTEPLSCLLELSCMDPMFQDVIENGEQISTWVGGWKWKFKLPFRMKQRGEPQKNIINEGDVETPVEIEFHGPAVNPKIINHSTGEFIRIKKEITSDEVLYINTAFGKKRVEIVRNGTREDAFDYIDLDSRFFSLRPGDNVIEYQSENGLAPQSVQIYYYNRYLGV